MVAISRLNHPFYNFLNRSKQLKLQPLPCDIPLNADTPIPSPFSLQPTHLLPHSHPSSTTFLPCHLRTHLCPSSVPHRLIHPPISYPTSSSLQFLGTIPPYLPLSEADRSLLCRGLRFSPLTPSCNEFQTRVSIHHFVRRVPLRAVFHNTSPASDEDDCLTDIGRRPSHWRPTPGQFPAVDLFAGSCRGVVDSPEYNV